MVERVSVTHVGWRKPISRAELTNRTPTSPPRPQSQDATGAGSTAHLEFDHAAHVTIRALEENGIAPDTGDEERGHFGSEPAAAGVLREGGAHRPRLDLALELGDQLGMPLGFPVHGVL